MPKIDGKDISREVLAEAMKCETPEDLVKLAKAQGVELTKEEAEAYLSEIDDIDLDSAQLSKVAGGYGNKPYKQRCAKVAWQ
ncbi:MAG: hypothetical protein IKZ66_03860 [Schwartzia sp.]|nr:hypothetical protein [Schwartzia sp. (in: firmicutes)]